MNDELVFWRTIKLAGGQRAMIDSEDYNDVSRFKWHLAKTSKKHHKNIGYVQRSLKGRTEYLHRRVMKCKPGDEVDHVRHDTLDNRKMFLRLVTHRQNMENHKRRNEYGTGIQKITYKRTGNVRYRAIAFADGKSRHVGVFPTAAAARAARAAFLRDHA